VYEKKTNRATIVLRNILGLYSLFFLLKGSDSQIWSAKDFIIETQEQLDFFIYNGRARDFFKD
jgi:hypothetical protein